MILGDYHTHTVFSHGKHKIEDNAAAAAEGADHAPTSRV